MYNTDGYSNFNIVVFFIFVAVCSHMQAGNFIHSNVKFSSWLYSSILNVT